MRVILNEDRQPSKDGDKTGRGRSGDLFSPLANRSQEDPAMVDRFEVIIAGMEIGNAYTELNNPVEQCRR